VGIEALSRGAKIAFLVEFDRRAVQIIRENLASTGLADEAEVYAMDVIRAIKIFYKKKAKFDIIFMGAPYDSPWLEKALEKLGEDGLLAEAGVIVAEHRKQHPLRERYANIQVFREVRYGETVLSFYENSHLSG